MKLIPRICHGEIVSLLEDTPDGLRMVEIAEHLRIENWRSLIPIMRELMDEGEIKKEDSTYFRWFNASSTQKWMAEAGVGNEARNGGFLNVGSDPAAFAPAAK